MYQSTYIYISFYTVLYIEMAARGVVVAAHLVS